MSLRAGVDLGGTKIQAVVLGAEGEVLGSSRHATPTAGGPADVIAQVAEAVRHAAEDAGAAVADLAGVGIGSPGDVDDGAGTVTSARNLPNWEGAHDVRGALGDALGLPVRLGNDVDVATVAEHRLGAGRGFDSLLGVFWGTGVGGGVLLDGRIWHGRASAGELGHVVVELGGARCPCGRLGCLEAYAGRGAMEARARREVAEGTPTVLFEIMARRGKDRLTSGVFERALDAGDELAIRLVDRALAALGAGIASACNLLDVEAVVVGGGLGTRLGQPWAQRILEAMLPHLFTDYRPPEVRIAELGDVGGATGAALLVEPAR